VCSSDLVISEGVRNDALIRTILQNSREPVNVGGDFESQLAALKIGAANLRNVAARYGHNTLAIASRAIQAQSEAAMRAAITRIADGSYHFEDFVDDDGIIDEPLRICVDLQVTGDELTVNFAGSSAQARGPVNCTLNMTSSAVTCAVLMCIGSEIPANAGVYRPLHVQAPPGTVVNARSPAPVANRMAVGHRVVNAVMGAFASAMPGHVPASYYGVSYAYALNCLHEDGNRQVYFDLECGGWGGHPQADGASGFSCGFHNIANSPLEMIEQMYPVTFTRYSLLADSGGAGKFRGGLGLAREFRLDARAGEFAANLDRFKIPPYGLDGGAPGRVGRLLVKHGDGEWQALASKVMGVALAQGDCIRLETAGGGGYGDPAARDVQAIANDRREGYVS
jgi:N-methylhydantoinase B